MDNFSMKRVPHGHKPMPSQAPKAKKTYVLWIFLALFIVSIGAISWYLNAQQVFLIKSVKIKGNYAHIEHSILQQIVAPYAKTNLLFCNTDALKKALRQLPWVAAVQISKQWPDALQIVIIEHKVIARWGEDKLLSHTGIVFTPPQKFYGNDLPMLLGPESRQALVWGMFLQLSAALNPLQLRIVTLEADARESWRLLLSNGMTLILGKTDTVNRLKRFVTVYGQIFGSHGSDVDYVDLRYPNGIAVHWKNVTPA